MPVKHGHALKTGKSRIYRQWHHMIHRCTNPKADQFKHYGQRGLTVYPFWMGESGFQNFLAFMGLGKNGWTIHRVDNDAGYFPENLVWADHTFQMRHTRFNRIVTVAGITACLSELCERFGIPYERTKSRLQRGWSVNKAFFHPPRTWPSKEA